MVNNSKTLAIDNPDQRTLRAVNLFWLGIILYMTAYTIASTDTVNWIVCNLIQMVGLLLFIPSATYIAQFEIEDNYLRIIFSIYSVWFTGVILRGIRFDYSSIKVMLFDPNFSIFLYIVPLVMLFPRTIYFYKRTFYYYLS